MRKIIFLFSIVFFYLVNVSSQETKKYFTIYLNGSVQQIDYFKGLDKSYSFIGFFPSFAYHKEYKRFMIQYEIMPLLMHTTNRIETQKTNLGTDIITGGSKQQVYESWLGLDLKFNIIKKDFGSINARLDNLIYYKYNSCKYYSSQLFDYNDKNIGLIINIGLEFEKRISEKITLSIVPLITYNDMYYRYSYISNPILPINDRKSSEYFSGVLPNEYYIKIGIKYGL
jgi:hypothetical protein